MPPILKLASILFVASVCFPLSHSAQGARSERWEQILMPSKATLPSPAFEKVVWREDVQAALSDAKRANLPLFVTMRCLPCKQCADFDKQVLEGGPGLDPLLRQFVTVRLTDANQINLRLFPVEGFQDLDLSWWGWFLSPDAKIYGVFGGKDHVSEKTRISKEALVNTLKRVLAHHYDPRRLEWNIDGFSGDRSNWPERAADLPGFTSWKERLHPEEKNASCIHCHQVADILRQPAIDQKKFDKVRDVEIWPFPENLGITLDRDHGLLVNAVAPDSAAAQVGLLPGDILGAAGDRRLFGQADFRGVLHRASRGKTRIPVFWIRGQQVMSGNLALEDGWKKTILDWRMSISQGNIGCSPGFFPLQISDDKRRRLGISPGTMAVEPFMGPNPTSAAYKAGLRQSDVVTAINGQNPDLIGRGFLVWFRQKYDAGDRLILTCRDSKGDEKTVVYELSQLEN